ncbi:hypothetical protein C6A85_61090, partial [Mycobacterium sp. ITM-2017-0098]
MTDTSVAGAVVPAPPAGPVPGAVQPGPQPIPAPLPAAPQAAVTVPEPTVAAAEPDAAQMPEYVSTPTVVDDYDSTVPQV